MSRRSRPASWSVRAFTPQQDAQSAREGGARWLVVGHVFEDEYRKRESIAATGFIERLAADPARAGHRDRRRAARERSARCVAAGAYGVAVIRGVWNANDAGAAVIDYLSAHGTPGGR